MGWVMAPATDAVVGAVPPAKSGVASATNTVARMVSGALGVAVVGSLVSSLYSQRRRRLARRPARRRRRRPPRTRSAPPTRSRRNSHPTSASGCLATTGEAFTQAMGTGLLVGAVLAAVAAVVVVRFLPAREPGAETDVADAPASVLVDADRAAEDTRKEMSRDDTTNRGLRAAGRHAHGRARQQPTDRSTGSASRGSIRLPPSPRCSATRRTVAGRSLRR